MSAANQGSSFQLFDIYYTLFRHKKKIIFFALAGLIAGGMIYYTTPVLYQSNARLLVRYVVESKVPGPGADKTEITSLDRRGENVLNSERAILTSLDLARIVVQNVGAERVLGPDGGNSPELAAMLVQRGLTVEIGRRSNIMEVMFTHPDPELARVLLGEIITVYYLKHKEIHRAVGLYDDFLEQQRDHFSAQVAAREDELKRLRGQANVMSIEEARSIHAALMGRVRQDLLTAQTELAEREAAMKELEPVPVESDGAQPEVKLQARTIEEYERLIKRLQSLREQEAAFLSRYTSERLIVQNLQAQIQQIEDQKAKMEATYPVLAASNPIGEGSGLRTLPVDEGWRIAGLGARIQFLRDQLALLEQESSKIHDLEPVIRNLERQKEMEEKHFRDYAASLEQARIEQARDSGQISNISTIQTPTPANLKAEEMHKKVAMAIFGGLAGGLAMAFLLEISLDKKVRRPVQLESTLGIPHVLTTPKRKKKLFGGFRRKGRLIGRVKRDLIANGAGAAAEREADQDLESDEMQPYHDFLRDRLINYFDARKMKKTPKLIAVTGCSTGCGVSSIAGGLAVSLAEIKEGGVLLVNMTNSPLAQHGRLSVLEDLLDNGNGRDALIRENLYVARGATANSAKALSALPAKFRNLAPRLRASDYDYIVFDMPPIEQTTITPCLSRFMDMVVIVTESEKTDQQTLQRKCRMLQETNENLVTVLNKHKPYVPKWLGQES